MVTRSLASVSRRRNRASARWALVARCLLLTGGSVLILGALGDLLFHVAPPALLGPLTPLLGIEGKTAHAITLVGMVITLFGVSARGIRP